MCCNFLSMSVVGKILLCLYVVICVEDDEC